MSNLGTINRLGGRVSFPCMPHSARWLAFALLWCLRVAPSHAQTQTVEVGSGTPLTIELPLHAPMKAGESLEGQLVYPVYVGDRVALPQGSIFRGRVLQLNVDRGRRVHARLRGDFTPFHVPVVLFDHLLLPNGTSQSISCSNGRDGIAVLRLSPPPGQQHGSMISRQWSDLKQRMKETATLITAPGRRDRLVQFVYTQLPYHPQRIQTGTTWTVELERPLQITLGDVAATKPRESKTNLVSSPGDQPKEWRLHAYLQQTLSSAKAKPGDTFHAYVAEPVFNADHAVVVPEGSILTGEITRVKPARSFGRQGRLRFHFKELKLPGGFSQPVEGALSGVDSDKATHLQMDPEGGVQPQSQNRVVIPLLLTFLASRAFEDDENRALNHGLASNGFGIVGRIVGIAASSGNVAAGIGIYGAALSFYDLWLAHGHDIVFPKDTRVEITTTPSRNPLKAANTSQTQAPGP